MSAYSWCRHVLQCTCPTVWFASYPVRADAFADQIDSFPLTISSHRIDELFSIMPGEAGGPAAYDQEKTTPYYYSTRFDGSLIQTEFSPTERCGYFRFTFPQATILRLCPIASRESWSRKRWRDRRRRAIQRHEGVCIRRVQRAGHVQRRAKEIKAASPPSAEERQSRLPLWHLLHQCRAG